MIPLLCPICKDSRSKQIANDIFLCKSCNILFNNAYQQLPYFADYFSAEYKNQYGKTYEDDHDAIYAASLLRIKKIKKLLNNNLAGKSLLDIGCALGFFCKAAKDSGFQLVEGLEISEYAAQYCKEKFSISVTSVDFEKFLTAKKYDVITAWYVMEHFANPFAMFQKVYSMLHNNGIFACTLPSYFGPLFYCHRDIWIKNHPVDHRIDVSPRGITQLLKNIGFVKVKCYPSGYHPERFCSLASKHKKIYIKLSDSICFSDTIMVIAKK